uniref:Photosystem II reaction center protein Psb30 n=1 Tax=Scotinosphaera sp. NIES-154 TaxID=2249731 RepID=A0A2Z4MAT0_9CHLO|nr:Ycf12 [Scotinosphaera sp. NIES-154]
MNFELLLQLVVLLLVIGAGPIVIVALSLRGGKL